jgi:alpha-glucosidase
MPWPDGVAAKKTGPFTTPWRTILITDSLAALADSRLELNLNEPNQLGDVSWFRPGKYVGIWWEMHLNKSTWGGGPTHGANTANVKRYIDFAAQYGFDGVLAEGWNEGWDGDWIANGDKFSFTATHEDFDIDELADYARDQGVYIIGHHETGGAVPNYESQIEDAYRFYRDKGVPVVKSGYVRPSGTLLDENGEQQWFAGQYMVRHQLHAVQLAAKYRIAINAHEPVKDTGLRRTYPNMISREGARGQEFNAWGRPTNPPEHRSILPFTRLLAGPMDFTPGIFDIRHSQDQLDHRVQSTVAAQLAEYVLFYSPVQMAADLPENYEARLDVFQFIRDVPADWEQSKTLQGEIGNFAVVARQARMNADWFLGAVTDENARTLQQALSFLEDDMRYEAQIYRDGPGADYRSNPDPVALESRTVTSADALDLQLAPGGGIAIRFRRLDNQSNATGTSIFFR